MGLTKQYLRYTPIGLFGVVAGKNCNAVYLHPKRFIASGGTNSVILWDIRLNRKVHVFTCDSPAVVLHQNHDSTLLAVGSLGGSVSIYDLKDKSENASPDPNVTFEGHTSEVLTIDWDSSGTMLASGGKDTRIILWDCVSETGIAKLKGHKGPVTRVRFWRESKYLVSSSTDTTIRVWDLTTNTCVHTLPGNSQIWDFCLWDDYIFVGDVTIRMFKISEDPEDELEIEFKSEELGSLNRTSNDRIRMLQVVEKKYLVAAGARSQELDIFHLNEPDVAEKKRLKRMKKDRSNENKLILTDLLRQINSCRTSEGKLRSINAYINTDGHLEILCCLPTNQVEVVSNNPQVLLTKDEKEALRTNKQFKLHGFDGHRKIIRGLGFSSDKTAILSVSGDAFKVWHRSSLACILTVNHNFPVVCCQFCPGDRHFVAGTTCGKLILVDISGGAILQTEQCGEDNVWGLHVFPNNLGFVATNGHYIRIYDFSMMDGVLRFDFQRELCVDESILAVKVSSNMRLIAVGLLDSTIKVYYFDTLKFHLCLYGHKLPVVAIDISSDNQLLASCSGDKSVKIWGLDFGDCHSSMIHTDGLIGVSFVQKTHHLVSVAKDSINFYDGDIHQRFQTIKAHIEGGSTAMAVGGLFVVTSGRDQSLRLFHRSEEVSRRFSESFILVLDDEREREREEDLDKETTVENPNIPSLQTAESERMADKLIEALDVFKDKTADFHPLLHAYGAKTHNEFMVKVLSGIKSSELEQSIMLLPVSYVHQMIPALVEVLENFPLATELTIRCLTELMRFHFASLRISDKQTMVKVATLAEQRATNLKDIVGFNVAGLKFLQQCKIVDELVEEFQEILGERKRRKRKREKSVKRALLTISK